MLHQRLILWVFIGGFDAPPYADCSAESTFLCIAVPNAKQEVAQFMSNRRPFRNSAVKQVDVLPLIAQVWARSR